MDRPIKIVLLGAAGQVGQEIQAVAKAQGVTCTAFDSKACDIRDIDAIHAALKDNFDFVVNASGFTAVDKAEGDDNVFAVNVKGVKNLAQACQTKKIPLIHLSTDYIFDGKKTTPYSEEDTAAPLSRYGLSKWQGEVAVREACEQYIILRISWVFGKMGQNFVKTILRLASEKTVLKIVNDQVGCPTAAASVADVILQLCCKLNNTQTKWGTYHYCNSPGVTWYDFAKTIVTLAGDQALKVKEIIPITTADLGLPAVRPAYSVLNCHKILSDYGIVQTKWQVSLEKMLAELNPHGLPL